MEGLGYSPVRQEEKAIVWEQMKAQWPFRELPQVMRILAPMGYAQLGEEGYEKQVVLDVFNRIIDSATRNGVSPVISPR
jgi:hypothetical protein